jgi:hypothetical protein
MYTTARGTLTAMGRRFVAAGLCLGVIIALGIGIACYDPPRPACGFICGNGGACPDDYHCATDNRCHLNGTPATLTCGIDAAIDGPAIETDANLTPPTVTSTDPSSGQTGFNRSTPIAIIMSEPVDGATNTSFQVFHGATALAGSINNDYPTGNHLLFLPNPPLPAGAVVTVNLTSSIHNALGVPLAPYSFSFTTIDDEAPTLVSSSPLDMDVNVPVNTTISITFSEPVMHVDGTSFSVAQGATAITGAVSGSGATYTFTPTPDLPSASAITVTLSSAITDAANNPLAATAFSFMTL